MACNSIDLMVSESDLPVRRDLLKPLEFDPTNLKAMKRIADELVMMERLDILINITDSGLESEDTKIRGISSHMLINHLGPMIFTTTLLPLLKKTTLTFDESVGRPDVRIVNVNSTAHVDAPASCRFSNLYDLNQIFPHDDNGEAYSRYAHSKFANALFSIELQRRLNAQRVPIIVTFPHPGAICTVECNRFLGIGEDKLKDRTLNRVEGALTPLFCAVHPRVREQEWNWKGKYVLPFGRIKDGNIRLNNQKLWTECWNGSMSVIEDALKAD
jgi:NAD(P)-dependent dehydrogenase (short-subunit alcohol dehydrogenase family)